MRQTPVNDYLEDISIELPEEIYGHLSDAIYETVCDFDEEVAQLKAENAKLRELIADVHEALCSDKAGMFHKLILASMEDDMRELGGEVSE